MVSPPIAQYRAATLKKTGAPYDLKRLVPALKHWCDQ